MNDKICPAMVEKCAPVLDNLLAGWYNAVNRCGRVSKS